MFVFGIKYKYDYNECGKSFKTKLKEASAAP